MDLGHRLVRAWRAAAGDAGGAEELTELLGRVAFLISGGWILTLTFHDWIRSQFFTDLGTTLAVLVAFGVGVIEIGLAVQTWFPARKLLPVIPLSIVYLIVVHYWIFVRLVPFYGTDGLAFSHYSAILLLRGQNPYAIDHSPALDLFRIPEFYVTPKESGGLVSGQTYPALAVLLYVPLVAAGITDMRIVSLAAHLIAVWLVFRLSPLPLKGFAPLTLAFPEQLDFTPGAVQDILWVPPLILAASMLSRRRLSGALYGIACSIKQVPWLMAPYLLVALWKEDGTRFPATRRFWSFVTFAAGAFLVLNGPFVAWGAAEWWAGVSDPLLGGNIPLGPGLSILSQGAWIQLPGSFYFVMMGSVALATLAMTVLDYPRVRQLIWWFPAVVSFFGYRSLQNYFVSWYPLVFLALASYVQNRINGGVK